MAIGDPIADMLTRLSNASTVRHKTVNCLNSKICRGIAAVLKDEGYVKNFRLSRDEGIPVIKVYLKYSDEGSSVIQGIRRISRPGLRRYSGYESFPRPLSGAGIAIVSTSKGVMTGSKARQAKIGGELLCEVW